MIKRSRALPSTRLCGAGFTVVELLVVMGIFMTMLTLSFINLTSLPSKTTTLAITQNLVSDIRSQQTLAMTGDSGGGGAQSAYGMHFENDGYTLFKGSVYNASDTTNFRVLLDDANLSFTNITFPNQTLVFSKGSGEVTATGSSTITNSLNNTTHPININKYGATN